MEKYMMITEKYEIKNGNGKVKEYHDNGKIKFEGKYLNGKKRGK